jgi:DNA (cytosine-5)-methyltransferase 1
MIRYYKLKSGKIFSLKDEEYITTTYFIKLLESGLDICLIDALTDENITPEISIKESRDNTRPILIDLFSGAGGLSAGLEMAGFKTILGVDIDKNALRTFKENHPHAEVYHGPIEELSFEYLDSVLAGQKVSLLAGGPPCQGFSTVGKGDPNDNKNQLFQHYCRVLDYLKPDYFLFENVTGILSKKNKPVLDKIINKFQSLGYSLKVSVLEAQKFGVPQKRKRAILMGTKLGHRLEFPRPSHDTEFGGVYIKPKTVGDALRSIELCDTVLNNEKVFIKNELVNKRLKYIPEGKGIRYKKDEDELLPEGLKLGVDWGTIREGRLRELQYYRLDRNKPSPTINTQNHRYYHPVETRVFTARELATFQSFPLEFSFKGSRSSQIRQIGNAVPPLLAKALGEAILNSYNSKEKELDQEVLLNDSIKHAFNYDNYKGLRERFQSSEL